MYYDSTHGHKFGRHLVHLPQGKPGRIGTAWSRGQFYESGLLKHVRGLDLKGKYVDAGMNIGNHTLFFAKCCKSTQVIGFEPYPIHVDKACELFRINGIQGKVRVMNCALGDAAGELDISIRDIPVTTFQLRLDDLALTDVALIKIDVEGAEMSVLKGAEATIREQKPYLFVEIFDDVFDTTCSFIMGLGYKLGRRFKSPTYEFIPV